MLFRLLATGDIVPDRPDPNECFAATRKVLQEADIVFGQLEAVLAHSGVRLPQARHAVLGAPNVAPALKAAGFNVISCAGNHCLDWGGPALLECLDHLNAAGVTPIGAGATIADARKPVVQTLPDGTKVAFLAASSILPQDYWATENRVGCVPMRAHTVYEQVEHDQPGTPARVHTFAHREDMENLIADIESAKKEADLVIVSLHWGIHFVRAELADYQREVAEKVIAAGADAILGHHAHILKGAELIEGKPVFYSLCNFATDLRMDEKHAQSKSFLEIKGLAEEWELDFDGLYNFPTASRRSMVAELMIEKGKIVRAGFLPVYIGRDAVPHIMKADDERFMEVVTYVDEITKEAGLTTNYRIEGDSVLLTE